MKRIYFITFILFLSGYMFSQNLTFGEIKKISSSHLSKITEFVISKGYSFDGYGPGERFPEYKYLTWHYASDPIKNTSDFYIDVIYDEAKEKVMACHYAMSENWLFQSIHNNIKKELKLLNTIYNDENVTFIYNYNRFEIDVTMWDQNSGFTLYQIAFYDRSILN